LRKTQLFKQYPKNGWSSFRRNDRGSIAIMAAVSIAVVIFVVGAAVDYTRASRISTIANASLDAAALAAAKELGSGNITEDQVAEHAKKYFLANLSQQNVAEVEFRSFTATHDPQTNSIRLSVDAIVPTTFTAIAGFQEISMNEVSVATFKQQDIELAMMLDVSGSMGGSRIRDLRDSANDLVDILTENSRNNDVRIGLAPYSTAVFAGPYARRVTDGRSGRCVYERGGVNAFLETNPIDDPLGGSRRMHCNRSPITPITADTNRLHREINRLSTGGWTAGHLGIAWAWYLISPEWGNIWPADSKPAAYDPKKTLKAVILMTDGAFNQYYVGANGNSNEQALELCANIRDKDIRIYTVAFRAPASAARLLRDCSNNAANSFDASSGDELRAAFKEIALLLLKLRISE